MNVIERVVELLTIDSIAYTYLSEQSKVIFPAKTASVELFIEVCAKDKFYEVATALPIKVPESRRKELAELICRINNKLVYGTFLMDYNDGELRYRVLGMIDQDKFEATGFDEFFGDTVQSCLTAIEDMHEIFLKVSFAELTAAQGMELVQLKINTGEKKRTVPEELVKTESFNNN